MEDVILMTAEEIQQGIDSGNKEILDGYLSGGIKVGDAEELQDRREDEEREIRERENPVDEIQGTFTTDEVITEITKTPQEAFDEQKFKNEINAQLETQKQASDDEISRLKRQLEIKNNTFNTPTVLNDEDKDELEFASTVTKNNRFLIDELKKTIESSGGPDVSTLIAKIDNLEAAEERRNQEQQTIASDEKRKNALKTMFSEIEGLQSTSKNFKTEQSIETMFNDYNSFRGRIKEFIRTDDNASINKAVRAAITGDDDKAKSFINKLSDVGINVPAESEVYLKLAEVVDLKNGKKYNKKTGQYDDIVDEYGSKVNQRSLEDAYKLSNYYNIVNDAERSASLKIQDKLSGFRDGAVTIGNDHLADPAQINTVNAEEAEIILNLPADTINKNPELKQKYDQIMKQYGL